MRTFLATDTFLLLCAFVGGFVMEVLIPIDEHSRKEKPPGFFSRWPFWLSGLGWISVGMFLVLMYWSMGVEVNAFMAFQVGASGNAIARGLSRRARFPPGAVS